MRTFGDMASHDGIAVVQIDRLDIHARGHDGTNALLIQTQHIRDDGLFAFMKDAGLGALLHQHLDFIVGHRRLLKTATAQQTHQQVA